MPSHDRKAKRASVSRRCERFTNDRQLTLVRNSRCTALESAVAFWDLLMPSAPTFGEEADKFTQRQLNLWKTFLTEKGNGRAISKDTWMLVSNVQRGQRVQMPGGSVFDFIVLKR